MHSTSLGCRYPGSPEGVHGDRDCASEDARRRTHGGSRHVRPVTYADELRRSAASADGLDRLDESQLAAAGAIAGTGGLAAITGPAGAGKTTMLRVAHAGTYSTAATDAGGRADPEGGIRRIARSRCRGDEPARAARRPRLPLAH
nr:AAA family ATPase [Microbacterium sp.]